MAAALGDKIETTYQMAEEFGASGNYVAGANITGFMKVVKSMVALGPV